MQLFYSTNILSDIIRLDAEESRHCLKVLRLHIGDKLQVTDGKGNLYDCEIANDDLKSCELKIVNTQEEYGKRNFSLHIAIAPTKNINRFEWFLEKCTEIGIDTVTPLICEHSERRTINIDRLNKVVIAALKQSYITYLPIINQPVKFKDFINSELSTQNYIAICDEDNDKKHLKDIYQKAENATILIGPEGDFSNEETAQAKKNGFKPVTISNNRLRTETAGVVACDIINLIND